MCEYGYDFPAIFKVLLLFRAFYYAVRLITRILNSSNGLHESITYLIWRAGLLKPTYSIIPPDFPFRYL